MENSGKFHLSITRCKNNSTHFSIWLWTMTQFNTPKGVMFLKVLLVIGNGFLIPTWKYWIWISRNESILRTTPCKGVDCSSIQNCVWVCQLVSVKKIPNSLLDNCKRISYVHTLTSQQFWKLTNNGLRWRNFKMHVTDCLSIIKQKNLSLLFSDSLVLCYYDFFVI